MTHAMASAAAANIRVAVWRELADDQTFWATISGASTALLIAVVLEARTGREELDRHALNASAARRKAFGEHETAFRVWAAKVDLQVFKDGPDAGDPPALGPLPDDDAVELVYVKQGGARLAVLVLTLFALAVALVGSLVMVSPAEYSANPIAHAGTVITLLGAGAGICGLLWVTTKRVTSG